MKLATRVVIGIILTLSFCAPWIVYSTQQSTSQHSSKTVTAQPSHILDLLHQQAPTLNATALEYAFTALQCANQFDIDHNNILTIIDYSLPASEKRLWVFDLAEQRLLFHTYVSHGLKTGSLVSNAFSNRNNSKTSSVGLYKTLDTYYGREGISLRMQGLEPGFNDNAENRALVMHGGWYVNEPFIQQYGRPGRSWGCPSLPQDLTKPILEKIRRNSLLFVYYPEQNWLLQSQFLHCSTHFGETLTTMHTSIRTPLLWSEPLEQQEPILYVDLNHNKKHEENEPIVAISAQKYHELLSKPAPVSRMLRRQMESTEYVAITEAELQQIKQLQTPTMTIQQGVNQQQNAMLSALRFIIPEIIEVRGYYQTRMKAVDLGKIERVEEITTSSATPPNKQSHYKLFLVKTKTENHVPLESTAQFIRWIGL